MAPGAVQWEADKRRAIIVATAGHELAIYSYYLLLEIREGHLYLINLTDVGIRRDRLRAIFRRRHRRKFWRERAERNGDVFHLVGWRRPYPFLYRDSLGLDIYLMPGLPEALVASLRETLRRARKRCWRKPEVGNEPVPPLDSLPREAERWYFVAALEGRIYRIG